MNKLIEIIRYYLDQEFDELKSKVISHLIYKKIESSGLLRPNVEDILKEAPEIKDRLKVIAARMDVESSEINSAQELLKTYNRWRRGEELPVPDPVEIGKAIDKLTL